MDTVFTEEEFMASLGFERVPHPDREKGNLDYDKYANVGGTWSTFYGQMWKHKRIITFNKGWDKHHVFCLIEEDGGTRKVFHGGIKTGEQLKQVLELVY